MAKHQQNKKQKKSRQSQTRNTHCLSNFNRTNLYRACNTLRLFAFYELETFHEGIGSYATKDCVFGDAPYDKQEFRDFFFRQLDLLRNSRWKAYSYMDCRSSIDSLWNTTTRFVVRPEHFNDDLTLTDSGYELRDHLRKQWEHKIKIGNHFYYYSSARQLNNVLKDEAEAFLHLLCLDFIEKANTSVERFFGDIEFDDQAVDGSALTHALGIRKLEKDYGLMLLLRGRYFKKGFEKVFSELIETYHLDPIENLVDDNYVARLIGTIQASSRNE